MQHEGRGGRLDPPLAEYNDAELHEEGSDEVVDVHSCIHNFRKRNNTCLGRKCTRASVDREVDQIPDVVPEQLKSFQLHAPSQALS